MDAALWNPRNRRRCQAAGSWDFIAASARDSSLTMLVISIEQGYCRADTIEPANPMLSLIACGMHGNGNLAIATINLVRSHDVAVCSVKLIAD